MELSYRSQYKNQDILLPTRLIGKSGRSKMLKMLRRDDYVLILLPAVRYTAILESRPKRTLDIFQEAVLRCMQTGEDSMQVISESLALHIDLVRRITQDMEDLELLKDGRVTERGEQALRGDSEEQSFSRCELYYDALRGCLWDAVCESGTLTPVNPSSGESGQARSRYERLTFGTVGNSFSKRAYYVHLSNSEEKVWKIPEKTDFIAEEKREAVRRALRRQEQFRWDWEDEEAVERAAAEIQAVDLISNGIPCYIGTLLCPEVDGWSVRHPFDGGKSDALRQFLDERKDQPGYEDLKQKIHDVWHVGDSQDQGVRWKSGGEMSRRLFHHAPEDIRLLELLSGALSSWQELKHMSNASAERHKSRLKNYVLRCYEALERTLKFTADEAQLRLTDRCPTYDLSVFLTNQTALNSEILAEKARSVGFSENSGRSFRRFFSHVPGAHLRDMGRKEMTVLLARNLLLMQDIPQHPFWTLLREGHASFLDDIVRLKPLRDSAMHAYELPFSFQDVEGFFPEMIRWLPCFFPDAAVDESALERAADALEAGEDDAPKPLSSPEQRLDEAVGAILHRFPDLLDMAIHVENLFRAQSPDLFQAICSVYECFCTWYVGEFMPQECRAQLSAFCEKEHVYFCLQKLENRGFPKRSAELTRWADSVDTRRARKAAKYGVEKKNPSIKLFLALYTAAVRDAPELERIAAERPQLIEQAADVILQRGHSSDDADPDEEKRRRAVEALYENLRSVLNAFRSSNI